MQANIRYRFLITRHRAGVQCLQTAVDMDISSVVTPCSYVGASDQGAPRVSIPTYQSGFRKQSHALSVLGNICRLTYNKCFHVVRPYICVPLRRLRPSERVRISLGLQVYR